MRYEFTKEEIGDLCVGVMAALGIDLEAEDGFHSGHVCAKLSMVLGALIASAPAGEVPAALDEACGQLRQIVQQFVDGENPFHGEHLQ